MSFENLRERMIDEQLIHRGISDRSVLEAMRSVKREEFLPPHIKNMAYDDAPVPIGQGQTISQPYIVARMTELLMIKKTDRVLEIGSGSGYQAAVLSLLAKTVFTIERVQELRKSAEENLRSQNIQNVFVMNGDGTIGLSQYAPFDKIIVTAAGPKIPKNLIDQIKEDGIIVMPVGNISTQVLVKGTKKDGNLQIEEFDTCRFVPLLGKYGFLQIGV